MACHDPRCRDGMVRVASFADPGEAEWDVCTLCAHKQEQGVRAATQHPQGHA